MDSTIRNNIKIGQTVKVILTNSANHPRGIKVKLEGGIVGRVCEIKG